MVDLVGFAAGCTIESVEYQALTWEETLDPVTGITTFRPGWIESTPCAECCASPSTTACLARAHDGLVMRHRR